MKFYKHRSEECDILENLFNTMPLMDNNIAKVIESFIYSIKTTTYRDGKIKSRYEVKNESKIGKYESWSKEGSLIKKCNYKNNKLDGLFQAWYDNGKISDIRNYKDKGYFYGNEYVQTGLSSVLVPEKYPADYKKAYMRVSYITEDEESYDQAILKVAASGTTGTLTLFTNAS